ncbi:CBS domain-containing protein [Infirmifilum sp. NZ]|uniref:CBS domain-containing protein n=1 Tax=Infirmifilum sp. NZ TaxID=2926850 RepID=UPI0027992925|nr:CBS domain-containing protein [Infirmifilum sp. NZ]UNQ72804.1 hypothetical protein MOV14_06720 [Infirmifilum sp. NZ]
MTYSEGVLKAETLQGVLEEVRRDAFKSLVASVGGELVYLGSLLSRVVGGRSRVRVIRISGRPAFSVALRKVSAGSYLVSERGNRAYTPRSLVVYMLETGMLSAQALLEKLKPHRLPCLKCNSTLKTAVTALRERGSIALPVCYAGQVTGVLTVADVVHYILSAEHSKHQLVHTRVSRVAGSLLELEPLDELDPVDALKRYSMLSHRTTGGVHVYDSSSLQSALAAIAGVV